MSEEEIKSEEIKSEEVQSEDVQSEEVQSEDVEQTEDFVRAGDDCQISGTPIGEAIVMCADAPVIGDVCGMKVVE